MRPMIAAAQRQPLGQLLIGKGVLQTGQLERALEQQRCDNHRKLLGEVLIDMRFCSEEQIVEALALACGVPFARIGPQLGDRRIFNILPSEFVKKNHVLPLFLVENMLTVAVCEPADVFLIERIERLAGHPCQIVAATIGDIKAALDEVFADHREGPPDQPDKESGPAGRLFSAIDRAACDKNLDDIEAESPAIRLLNHLLQVAIEEGAADIHLEPLEEAGRRILRIRHRIDGRLVEKPRPPAGLCGLLNTRIKMLAGLDPAGCAALQEGHIRIMPGGRAVDLRINVMPTRLGEKIVIHILDAQKEYLNLEKLGFNYDQLKQWRRLIAMSGRLLIVSGPADSGKSATLCATLKEINAPDLNICTIEDSIERAPGGVNQFQVDEKKGLSYASVLQSLLSQNPDVLLIGDIRDSATARLAVQAALTGRLVLGAFHAQDATAAITRLFHLGVEPHLIGATLGGVLAQRLVRKLCQNCRAPYEPSTAERRRIGKFAADIDRIHRPRGCDRCRNIGFTGRIGIHELLIADDAICEQISGGAPPAELRRLARQSGMKTLWDEGLNKVRAGITTLDEIYRAAAA